MREGIPRSNRHCSAIDACFLSLLALAAFWPPYRLGREGFLLFDYSLVVDSGWRILNGQLPYRDFVLPSGPGCFLIQALFFKLMGPKLDAALVHVGVVNTLAALAVYWMIRRRSNSYLALGSGLVTALWFCLPFPFPRYDTTAFLFVFLAHLLFERGKTEGGQCSALCCLLMGGSIGASFLSKQNVGLFAVVPYALLLFLLARNGRWIRVIWFLSGFGALVGGTVLCFALLGGGDQIIDGLFVRPFLTGRGKRVISPLRWIQTLERWPIRILVGSLILSLLSLCHPRTRRLPPSDYAALLGLPALSLLAALTGNTPRFLFIPFLGLCVGLYAATFTSEGSRTADPEQASPTGGRGLKRGAALGVSALILAALGLWGVEVGLSKRGRTYALWRCNFETSYALKAEALKPFSMDEELGTALDEALLALKERNAVEGGIYVFPNVSVLYLALGYVSPIPYVWIHPTQSFFQRERRDEEKLISALATSNPEWILLWDGFQVHLDRADALLRQPPPGVRIPPLFSLNRFLEERYGLDEETEWFRILKRRP